MSINILLMKCQMLPPRSRTRQGSPVVRTWYFHCWKVGVQFLVGELRSHKPRSAAKKKQTGLYTLITPIQHYIRNKRGCARLNYFHNKTDYVFFHYAGICTNGAKAMLGKIIFTVSHFIFHWNLLLGENVNFTFYMSQMKQ